MTTSSRPEPRLLDLHPPADDLLSDVLEGLSRPQKTLPCKYFYDAVGSELFERICDLPEYYPTRTEMRILEDNIGQITVALGPGVQLLELGSGSSAKTRLLLDRLIDCVAYVPIDISRSLLLASAVELSRSYPGLEILPVCADFTAELRTPRPSVAPRRRVWFFPGSTIGNFDQNQAVGLLGSLAAASESGDQLLLGVDLRKDPDRLERAYDDASGVTAAFNKNILRRINAELGGDFDLDAFEHRARWNDAAGRVEMHLVAQRPQVVHVGKRSFDFAAGETIFTESSHKYALDEFDALEARVGFTRRQVWTDDETLFSVQLFRLD